MLQRPLVRHGRAGDTAHIAILLEPAVDDVFLPGQHLLATVVDPAERAEYYRCTEPVTKLLSRVGVGREYG